MVCLQQDQVGPQIRTFRQAFTETATLPLGPLRLGTPRDGNSRAHLINSEGRAVGCAWHPKPDRVRWIPTKSDWDNVVTNLKGLCTHCFFKYSFPESWDTPSSAAAALGDQNRASRQAAEEASAAQLSIATKSASSSCSSSDDSDGSSTSRSTK